MPDQVRHDAWEVVVSARARSPPNLNLVIPANEPESGLNSYKCLPLFVTNDIMIVVADK